jgi:hypothetical protein
MSVTRKPGITLETFERGEVDAESFDHEAHVYLGWLYLERYPLLEAIRRYRDGLRRLTARLGAPGKYHETITWFFLVQIDNRRRLAGTTDWPGFRRDNPDLFRARPLLARYYSPERVDSDTARRHFLLPDRIADPLPFRTGP